MMIVAGIVTYNPDLARLRENLTAVVSTVERVLLVDNASRDRNALVQLAAEFDGVQILHNVSNQGIATALNQIARWAIAEKAKWMLLLDQDSVCAPGMVPTLARHIAEGVGMVVPEIHDRNLASRRGSSSHITEVNHAITSGSLASVDAWRSVGGYDENLFIDYVDFDYCLRVRTKGHRIVRDPQASLLHEIGNSRRHGRVIAYHHSAFRSYHMSRDMLFYARKHRKSPPVLKVQGRGLAATYLVLIRKALIVAAFEEDRPNRVWALLRGAAAETLSGMPKLWTSASPRNTDRRA